MRPTRSHGKWPSSSGGALTAVLPSSPHAGCCLQPTAKPGTKEGLGVHIGHSGQGLRDLKISDSEEERAGAWELSSRCVRNFDTLAAEEGDWKYGVRALGKGSWDFQIPKVSGDPRSPAL